MTNQLRSYETQVLLLGWRNDFPKVDPVNLFEIFSGAANTTKWWWLVCTYKFIRSSMIWFYLSDPLTHHDLGTNVASNVPPSISHTAKPSRRVIRWISTSHRGFCTLASVVVQITIYIVYIYIERILHGPGYFMNLPCSYMRLCLYVIMQELPNALNLMAPDCGSWGIPARGTTRRAFHNYLGCSYPFVLSGNLMVARSLDLQYVIHLTWWCSTYIYEHQNLSPFWGWYCAVWWSWHDVPSSSLKIPMEVWFFGTTDLNTWPTWWHLNLS